MAIVEKGNVVLEIKDSEVGRYLDLGYNETDGHGNILNRCMPKDIGTLQLQLSAAMDKIKELEEENVKLRKEMANLNESQTEEKPKRKPRTPKSE